MNIRRFQYLTWTLSLATVGTSLAVWWPSARPLTINTLFPLLGLVAFGLMWSHYASGALRRYFALSDSVLQTYTQITGYIVLFCILAHPFLFELQLYLDGLGMPPASIYAVYPEALERAAIYAGVVALLSFVSFELYRLYKTRSWWKYIEWANIGAMLLILWHGFVLGGELRTPWFQAVWLIYAVTFIVSVTYTGYDKRRHDHGAIKDI